MSDWRSGDFQLTEQCGKVIQGTCRHGSNASSLLMISGWTVVSSNSALQPECNGPTRKRPTISDDGTRPRNVSVAEAQLILE